MQIYELPGLPSTPPPPNCRPRWVPHAEMPHKLPKLSLNNPSGAQTMNRHQAIAQTPSMSLGMSPSERYESNLRVLRKRDPSIVSIFDQFGHVCVYHYVNKKWEKNGYEGSMFLFER